MLAATVVGIRQALDYDSTWRAPLVVGIGFLAVIILLLLGGVLSGATRGIGTLY